MQHECNSLAVCSNLRQAICLCPAPHADRWCLHHNSSNNVFSNSRQSCQRMRLLSSGLCAMVNAVGLTSMPIEAIPKGMADSKAARAVALRRLPSCKSSGTSSAALVPACDFSVTEGPRSRANRGSYAQASTSMMPCHQKASDSSSTRTASL